MRNTVDILEISSLTTDLFNLAARLSKSELECDLYRVRNTYLEKHRAELLRTAATWTTHPSGMVSVKRLLDEADKLEGK